MDKHKKILRVVFSLRFGLFLYGKLIWHQAEASGKQTNDFVLSWKTLPILHSIRTRNQLNSIYKVESILYCFNFVLFSDLFFYHRLKSLVLFGNCSALLILFRFVYLHSLTRGKQIWTEFKSKYLWFSSQLNQRRTESAVHFITAAVAFFLFTLQFATVTEATAF